MDLDYKVIYYLTPSSFCWGVEKSLKELDVVIQRHPDDQIYCIHAIVHNPGITKSYRDKGVIFVETIDEIDNPDAVVTFSAHGTNREILLQAAKKFKAIYNLECPLVTKIYKEIDMYIKKGISTFFYIAQPHHQEAKNVMGYMQSLGVKYYVFQHSHEIPLIDPSVPFTVLSQTTLNYAHVKQVCEDIAKSYPDATFPPLTDICKATYDRQTVIIQNIDKFDTLIVIGGKESHNTKELYQLGVKHNKTTFFGEDADEILQYGDQLLHHTKIGLTGGASTPPDDIQTVFKRYIAQGYQPKILNLVEEKGDYH